MKRNFWIEIIASLFILLFVYTSANKFIDFQNFRSVLHGSPLIREKAYIIAWLIPITELLISVFLFFPKLRRLGLWGSLIIMTLFTGYLAYMLFFSDVRPCSCGGVISKMTWNQHFIFNIFFTLLAIVGIWLSNKQNKQIDISVRYSSV
jgi:hypothetical protein